MSNEQSEKVVQFIQLTGSDEERAKFYLQSSNWELQTAVGTFFDNDLVPQQDSILQEEIMQDDSAAFSQQGETSQGQSNAVSTRTRQANRIVTLGAYKDEVGDSKDEDGQAFYAGGSESSGQQILGPKKDNKEQEGNRIKDIFKNARQHGAEEVSESERYSKKASARPIFKGAGFKLGSDVQSSEQVGMSLTSADMPQQPKHVKIKFWKNGFSTDNGPLRDFKDPQNKEFLASISRGDVPSELRQSALDGEVHVDMEDHSEEEYVKPKEALQAFGGTGYTLGSPTPGFNLSNASQNSSTTQEIDNSLGQTLDVDKTKPVTTIQIRLADGTRLVSKFNHHNTVEDIRKVVLNARPNTKPFKLMTTFPNKVLIDDFQSISDAKLLNAVIVQRML